MQLVQNYSILERRQKKLKTFLELSIEITYKKRTYDARLGEISGDSYGKSYAIS